MSLKLPSSVVNSNRHRANHEVGLSRAVKTLLSLGWRDDYKLRQPIPVYRSNGNTHTHWTSEHFPTH